MEFALLAPLLLLLLLGASDLSRAFYQNIEVSGAARAGLREAVRTDSTDIGDAVRNEPNTGIPCTADVWGQAFAPCGSGSGASGTDANCSGATPVCGDPQGCDPVHSSFWTTPGPGSSANPVACFAVQTCTETGSAPNLTCTYNPAYNGAWNTRPPGCNGSTCPNNGIVVKVVYKYTPQTPLISALVASAGSFYLTATLTGLQLY